MTEKDLTVGSFVVGLPAGPMIAVTIVQVSLLLAGTVLCAGGTLALGWLAGGAAQRSLGHRYDAWHRTRFGDEEDGRRRDSA